MKIKMWLHDTRSAFWITNKIKDILFTIMSQSYPCLGQRKADIVVNIDYVYKLMYL